MIPEPLLTPRKLALAALLVIPAAFLGWNFYGSRAAVTETSSAPLTARTEIPTETPTETPEEARRGAEQARSESEQAPSASQTEVSPPVRPTGITRITRPQFDRLTQEVAAALPTLLMLRSLNVEEVHGVPAAIHEAGFALGRVARALQENPELKYAGLMFYDDCATREDLPKPVRALCYANLKSVALQAGLKDESDPEDYPEEVRDLARELDVN